MNKCASAHCSGQDYEVNCDKYTAQLAEYLYAEIAGDIPMDRYTQIATHLNTCSRCAMEYTKLKEIAQLAYIAEKPSVPPPQFDLSFLDKAAQNLPFSDMFGSLTTELPPILAQDKAQSDNTLKPSFTLGLQQEDKHLQMVIYKERKVDEGRYCALTVKLALMVQEWQISSEGVKATLKYDKVVLEEQYTDPSGQAYFEKILVSNLDRLVLELT